MPSSPPPITFSSLARGRVSFEIVAQVTQAIAQGSIPLGSYLPTEPQLMAQFGVGRNALREAIKILEAFGLVTVRRGAGPYVQDSCTFDLLVPLFLRLLWLSPTKEDLQGAFQGLGTTPEPWILPPRGRRASSARSSPWYVSSSGGVARRSASPPSPRQGKSKRPPVRSSGRSSRTWPTGNSVPGTNSLPSRT